VSEANEVVTSPEQDPPPHGGPTRHDLIPPVTPRPRPSQPPVIHTRAHHPDLRTATSYAAADDETMMILIDCVCKRTRPPDQRCQGFHPYLLRAWNVIPFNRVPPE
jgi:hypothetical protein